jgi:tetratricopeptide (TPR) repeat protein
MLFDHERKKEKQAWYIKVGGLRLTLNRILILCGFLLVFLLCLGACFFYALKDLGRYRNYTRAVALFENGEYIAAKELFVKVLAEDPNKEDAVAAIAEIYHHYGDWGNEAFFRQRLMRLNPLDQKLRDEFLESAFRARNFGVIYTFLNLKVMEDANVLSPDEGALYVLSAIQSGHVPNGKAFYDLKRKTEPRYFQKSERGRLVEMKMSTKEMDGPRVREILAFLDDLQDPMVRFETINYLLYYYSRQNDRESDEKMEELLREATELNEFAGAPLLANFYFSHYRFDDTIKVCETYLETKINAIMPVFLGESFALSGQSEKIPSLVDLMHGLHVRQANILALYLDALKAFCEGDNERLQRSMLAAGSTIKTPLSGLMALQIAILTDSSQGIRQSLNTIMKGRPFMDFQQRARTAALYYLMDKVKENDLASDPDRLNDCAEIAALIQTPGDDVSFLRRIILLDHFTRNVLTEDELQTALGTFPGDPVLLQIAAKYYLLNGKPTRSMEYIVEYNELKDVPSKGTIAILHMVTLDQLGRKADAEKEFRAIVERGEDDSLLYLYYSFCVENNFLESLGLLAEWLEALPKNAASRSALPFVRAEILYADAATRDQALDLFEKSSASDSRFIFHAASRLVEAGRFNAALSRYLSIQDTYPDKVLLNVSISNLYGKKGDKKSELAFARNAWQMDKNNFQARYAYGKLLFDEGQVADAFSVLGSPQYRAEFPADMLALWEKVVRAQIKLDFDAARYTPVMENARRLLTFFPDDKEAREYLDKVEKIRQLQKNSVRH